MKVSDAATLRQALQDIPRDQSSSIGKPPAADDILFLPSHASALDPDISLVIGNRGMGKTFWASALVNDETRLAITRRGQTSRAINSLKNYKVSFAFSDRQGVIGVTSKHVAKYANRDSEDYWRAVVIGIIADLMGITRSPHDTLDSLMNDTDRALNLMAEIDRQLTAKGTPVLILFDQLDQLADDWGQIQKSTKGILRLALACRSYRSIKIKIFMRPDQAADEEIFRFSDASKIIGPAASLRWFAIDLFGLLFKHIWNHPLAKAAMEENFSGLLMQRMIDGVPSGLLNKEELQKACFEHIAGTAMGNSTKRGKPYTWLITHLADGKQQISPRSFLTAIRVAAEYPQDDDGLAIGYKGIQEGVAEASTIRHAELEEDYPWIEDALKPLRGQTVPAWREDFYEIWAANKIPQAILRNYADSKAPLEIVRADKKSLPEALERSLVQLGVLEDRDDARVNLPDIFRISAGLKRKGGVPPQRRKAY